MKHEPLAPDVRSYLLRENVRDGTVVVAFSGGPDSLALLHVLHQLAGEFSLPVHAAHLNHQLRGQASDDDEAFARDFCGRLQVPCYVERIPVRQQASDTGDNLESFARRTRYTWLENVAHSVEARWVATGHQADDQAETVLHHLLRGTGLRGLRGIALRRPLVAGIDVIRPLLAVTRQEIQAYLKAHALTPRHDATNDDTDLTRNRIRVSLLPLLRDQYNPRIVSALNQLAEQVQADWRILESRFWDVLRHCEKPRAGSVIVLLADALRQYDRHLRRTVFRYLWEREGWPVGRMSFSHWDALAGLVDANDGQVDLPEGCRARRRGRVLQLWRDEPPTKKAASTAGYSPPTS